VDFGGAGLGRFSGHLGVYTYLTGPVYRPEELKLERVNYMLSSQLFKYPAILPGKLLRLVGLGRYTPI